jgi:hypothetical protein
VVDALPLAVDRRQLPARRCLCLCLELLLQPAMAESEMRLDLVVQPGSQS